MSKPSEGAPKTSQNRAQRHPREPRCGQEHLEAPKRRPRGSAEAPKRVQKVPKSGQVAPKTGPRGPQTLPKTSLGTTKTSLGHDIGAQFHSEGSYSDFLLFLEANAKTIEFALTGEGHSFCEVLTHLRHHASRAKKPRQMWPWTLQEPGKESPGSSKIEAGASQVAKKTTNRGDKCSKTRKMRPRSA